MIMEQVTAFALTIGAGLLAGFLFDFYRALHRVFRLKRTGTFLGDLVFCLLLTVFVFGLLLAINYGEVRFYVILGLALGALLYWQLFSKFGYGAIMLSFRFLKKSFHLLVKLAGFIWKTVTFPFRAVYLALLKPLMFFCRGIKAIQNPFRKAPTIVLNLLKKFFKRV